MVNWVRTHKLVVGLILIILIMFFKDRPPFAPPVYRNSMTAPQYTTDSRSVQVAESSLGFSIPSASSYLPLHKEAAPTAQKDRLVIQESNVSLQVDNVVDVQKKIIQKAQQVGGYMVNSSLSNPQDAPTSNLTIRVPANKLDETLEYFRGIAVKVISENLIGDDVTDQYVDNNARLETLMKTKAKFDEILNKATSVQDILTVQRELINLQNEIDAIKGQQNFYEKSAQMAKLTVYLATDELALPYAPSESWRPAVIFKEATRSMIATIRGLGTLAIWLAVYAVIWVPLLALVLYLRKRSSSK